MNPFQLDTQETEDFPLIDFTEPESISDDVQDVLQWQRNNERNSALGL